MKIPQVFTLIRDISKADKINSNKRVYKKERVGMNHTNSQLIIVSLEINLIGGLLLLWALTDSNRRPSACKADALNQLS